MLILLGWRCSLCLPPAVRWPVMGLWLGKPGEEVVCCHSEVPPQLQTCLGPRGPLRTRQQPKGHVTGRPLGQQKFVLMCILGSMGFATCAPQLWAMPPLAAGPREGPVTVGKQALGLREDHAARAWPTPHKLIVRARAVSGVGQAAGGPQERGPRREDGARLPPAGRAPAVPPQRPLRAAKPHRSGVVMLTENFKLWGVEGKKSRSIFSPLASVGLPNPRKKKWKCKTAALSVPQGFQLLNCTPLREQVSQVIWTQIAERLEHHPWRTHPERQKRPDAPSELSQTGQPCECVRLVSWLSTCQFVGKNRMQ